MSYRTAFLIADSPVDPVEYAATFFGVDPAAATDDAAMLLVLADTDEAIERFVYGLVHIREKSHAYVAAVVSMFDNDTAEAIVRAKVPEIADEVRAVLDDLSEALR